MGHTDDAMHELQRLAQDYPDSPLPRCAMATCCATSSVFRSAIAAYDRAIARIKTPPRTDWLAVLRSRASCYDRAHQWAQGGGGLRARADSSRPTSRTC